jgi:DinB superfamily
MQYTRLNTAERAQSLRSLAAMPAYLYEQFHELDADSARLPGVDGVLSPVEQVWHLADLEREGFAVRIRRLREEDNPTLADFDGTQVARERHYRSRSLREGLEAFRSAREANLKVLSSLGEDSWTRAGVQEGVGVVRLCDMPAFLLQHDEAHRLEIEAWKRGIGAASG